MSDTGFAQGTSGGVPKAAPPEPVVYPTVPHPLDDPEAWAHVVVCGLPSPGLAEVSGAARSWKWDVKEAKGKSGASVTGGNKELSKPAVKLKLWRRGAVDHIADWFAWRPVLGVPNPDSPVALDIYHPALELSEIRSVVVDEIGELTHEGKGLWSVTVKFIEYRKPVASGGTPAGSASKNSNAPGNGSFNHASGDINYDALAAESGGRVGDAVEAAVADAKAAADAAAAAGGGP